MRMGKNSLVPLILSAQWEAVVECAKTDTEQARKWITAQSFTGNLSRTEILALHQACSISSVEVNAVKQICVAYPEALNQCETGTGRTPLHIAIRARVSNDVIYYLMRESPRSIFKQDALGRLPLHYACSNQLPQDVVRSLIESDPESVRAADNLGWTPLHVAASLYQSVDVVQYMLSACPEAVLALTNKGNSTAVVAATNPSIARESILEAMAEVENKFLKMPAFQNMRAAELRMKNKQKSPLAYSMMRKTQTWGVRKRVRSNSIRCVV